MKPYFCPYCKHEHSGWLHLMACEANWIQRAPIAEVVAQFEKEGIHFRAGSNPRLGGVEVQHSDEEWPMVRLLLGRMEELEQFLNDGEKLDEKWGRLVDNEVAPMLQDQVDAAEHAVIHSAKIARGLIPPDH